MKNLLHLIKLEYMLERKHTKTSKNIVDGLFCMFASIIVSIAIVFLFVNKVFVKSDIFDAKSCFSIVCFVLMVIIFLHCLTKQQKNVYLYKNKTLLQIMPVGKKEIFFAKMLKNLIDTYAFSLPMILSSMITLGAMTNVNEGMFVAGLSLMILMPLIPYAVSSLILIPLSYILNLSNNKYIARLIVSTILTIFVFYVYGEIVFAFAEIIFLRGADNATVLDSFVRVVNFKGFANSMIANLVAYGKFDVMLAMYIVCCFALTGIALFVGAVCYKNIFMKDLLDNNTTAKLIKTKLKQRSPFKAYLAMEFKGLFRSDTYAYTYFGMAVVMPFMILFCGDFVLKLAETAVGNTIIFGTILLVVMMFCSVICSPSASFISKEGECFWVLRTSPNTLKISMLAKAFLGVAIAISSVFSSMILVVSFGFVSILQALSIFAISVVFVVGLVAMGMLINIHRPNLFLKNRENHSNMILQTILSVLISFAVGYMSIVLAFKMSFVALVLIDIAVVIVFAIAALSLLFTSGKKAFAMMEV